MRNWIFCTVILLIIVGCVGDKRIEVSVEKVEKRTITEIVAANGKLRPVTEIKIQPEVSGEIVELYVKEGDSVRKGQLLLEINPDVLQSVTEGAEATLNNAIAQMEASKSRRLQAKAQLERAEADFRRQKKLFENKAISEAEYDAAKAFYESARADFDAMEQNIRAAQFAVEQARANLSQAQRNLKRTKIFAPVSGVVSMIAREKGERVVGSIQMEGSEIMRIADMQQMQVVADINEHDIVRLKLGDSALISVDAYPNRLFRGRVSHLANSPKSARNAPGQLVNTDEVASFEVKVLILSESYPDTLKFSRGKNFIFKPGMSARIEIMTQTIRDVPAVSIAAVTTREDEGSGSLGRFSEYVFLRKGDFVLLTKVKTGIQDNKYIAILEGLQEGDEVVNAPYGAISRTLRDSSKITVVPTNKLFSDKE